MTIQRTVLLSLAGLLITPAANAQCARSRAIIVRPSHYHHTAHSRPYVAYRPYQQVSGHLQTVEVPPAPGSITFGGFSHVDELALRMEILMNELCLDLYYNYSHNPDFHATYSEAYSLYQTARNIHAAEHNFDRASVQQQLGGADELFHHIQDDVRGWTRIPRRQIGVLGIVAKMEMAEDTLHHLMEDVGVSLTTGLEVPPAPLSLPAGSPPPAPRLR